MTGYLAQFEPAMRLALEQAAGPSGAAPPADVPDSGLPDSGLPDSDVPVGAIVLDGAGTMLGSGRNRREADADPTAHAEVIALRAAARALGDWRLDGCTLVVTLEPCTMCAGAVLAARISRLVYGADDARAGAAGSRWDVLHDRRLGPPVEVIGGVLADDSTALLREFFRRRRNGPPDPRAGTRDPDVPPLR